MASIPCIEIFKFAASDAYKADPSIFEPVAQSVLNTAGCHGCVLLALLSIIAEGCSAFTRDWMMTTLTLFG